MAHRIFLYAPYFSNSGPALVNKNLVTCLQDTVAIIHFKNRYLQRIEVLLNILWANTIVISALGFHDYEIKLAILLGRKIIYIMHGFGKDDSPLVESRERFLMPRADLILCVSGMFCQKAKEAYPQFADRMNVLFNGVDWNGIKHSIGDFSMKQDVNEIVLIGGGRRIKNNLNVCNAVSRINDQNGTRYHISVFGQYSDSDESPMIANISCVAYVGIVSHEELLKKLASSALVVQNSDLESFGLSVIEALVAGCSILVSQHVGANDIITGLEEMDVINDPSDIEELSNKIHHVMMNANNERLLSSINYHESSIEFAAEKLLCFCNDLYE